jgi:hypothetical protein
MQNDLLKKYCETYTDSLNGLVELFNKFCGTDMEKDDLNYFFSNFEKIIRDVNIKVHNLNIEAKKAHRKHIRR